MKRNQALVLIVAVVVGICSFFMLASPAYCQSCEQWVAKIVSVQGAVQVRKAKEKGWNPVQLNQTYCSKDRIRVLKNSRAAIALSNDSLIRVDQNTTITFTGIEEEKTFIIGLIRGVAHFFSRFQRKIRVSTPFVNAAVEGTEFYVRVEDDRAFLSVFEGRVLAVNSVGRLVLTGGQAAVARVGKAPVRQTVVKPRDAVQWALYYPPIIDWRAIDLVRSQQADWQGMARKSIDYYWQGDMVGAFSALEKAPEEIRGPHFYLYRAALLLTVGRVDDAQSDISKALALEPSNSYAVALQSIIAVVQNEKQRALDLANHAVELAPRSSTPRVALSYAQQAYFDIQGALISLKKAVELGPDNALAWSRLAELFLSVGELTKAAEAAKKAVALNPGLARTQTVLGFTYIDRVKIREAKETFTKAILLDSAAPLPRLGLGLAKIRGGDLKEGRAEIEIAASLDPNSSLIRSYLGKAYYDEKQGKLAEDQYVIAKELDPLDPTPWFYDAIRKQTINRPVEALMDMQKSVELNNNRAVYRSRLLLDEDLAARSAGLGRIFNDLGFQQLGLVEGWKSVNTAPANYSAHRLLADLYAGLPRHEIARTNELYQSQLLQPLNVTPVQPQLAANNLFILEGAGPSDPSFNEFNPLFLRNRIALQASGVIGNNETWGNDIALSGVLNQFSYSFGQFHYETDGFRKNNDQNRDLYNAFVQASLTPKTSVLGEYRYSDVNKGDLELTFKDSFIPTLNQEEIVRELKLGLRHAFTPKSELLTSFIYQNADLSADVIPDFFELDSDIDYYIGEIRYLYQSANWNITGGGGYRYLDEEEKDLGFPTENFETKFTNVYAYTTLDMPGDISLTLGGSGEFLDGATSDEDRDKINPKLGLIWNPVPATTLRAAVFRTLQRPRVSNDNIDPSLEPTQVAGFNQFFLDAEGDAVWHYGIALDQKLPQKIYGGAELIYRDLSATIFDDSGPSPTVNHRDWDEWQARAYLYWALHPWWAFSVDYLFEHFKRDAPDNLAGVEEFTRLETHRFPLAVRFIHPSGLSADLKATYVNQDGDFIVEDFFGPVKEEGDDQFWVLDASIGYRLPKRYGLISLVAKNLLDNQFNFQDTDPGNPRIVPERSVLLKATLSF